MRAPLSWIREFADLPASVTPAEISDALVRVGFEIEDIELSGADLVGPIVVGQVKIIEEITEFKKPIRWVGLDCGQPAHLSIYLLILLYPSSHLSKQSHLVQP